MEIPLIIFIHIGAIDVNITQPILNKIITNLTKSGLYSKAKKIYYGIVGKDLDLIKLPKKFEIVYKNYDPVVYEIPTINKLLDFAKSNTKHYILYLHTKGVTKKKCNDINYQEKWSDIMQYFCITKYKKCIEVLDKGYDTVGCLLQHKFIFMTHYCGNFWWCNSEYIKTRPYLPKDTSGWGKSAEFWVVPKININTNCASLYNNKITSVSIPPCSGLYGNNIENYENSDIDNIKTGPKLLPFILLILIVSLVILLVIIFKKGIKI
jgi:hypothetical protein